MPLRRATRRTWPARLLRRQGRRLPITMVKILLTLTVSLLAAPRGTLEQTSTDLAQLGMIIWTPSRSPTSAARRLPSSAAAIPRATQTTSATALRTYLCSG
ncbi:unnamed protein product, partial [Symbiodinium pilosum]